MRIETSSITMQSEHYFTSDTKIQQSAERFENAISQDVRQSLQSNVLSSMEKISNFSQQDLQFHKEIVSSLVEELAKINKDILISSQQSSLYSASTSQLGSVGALFDSAAQQDGVTVTKINEIFEKKEQEMLNFSVEGIVKTAKGEINVNIQLGLSRQLASAGEKSGLFVDPLVINFDAPSAQLSQKNILI